MQPVGRLGFAICSDTHVFAFEVLAETGQTMLMAVLSLQPLLAGAGLHQDSLIGDPVVCFFATPYDFILVLQSRASCVEAPDAAGGAAAAAADGGGASDGRSRNAFCCLWPQVTPPERRARQLKHALELKGWVRDPTSSRRTEQGSFQHAHTQAVCLNEVLLAGHGAPAIDALAFHVAAPPARASTASEMQPFLGASGGSGLLAVSAQGPGVSVFHWGVEASPELDMLRKRNQDIAEEEEEKRRHDGMQLKVQRLSLRLLETDKLEERLKESGPEALTEEEHAKLQRRPQAEAEVQRLSVELGLGQEEGEETSEEEELDPDMAGRSGNRGLSQNQQDAMHERKRAKEKQQKDWGKNKMAQQKERGKNRDRKFTEEQ